MLGIIMSDSLLELILSGMFKCILYKELENIQQKG